MAKFNGTKFVVSIGGTTIASSRSVSVDVSRNMIDMSTADSGANREVLPGLKATSVTCEALYETAQTAATGYNGIWSSWDSGTQLTISWTQTDVGEVAYSASAYIESAPLSATFEGEVTYSVTFQIDGAVTATTIV